jgi:hypothetical protein
MKALKIGMVVVLIAMAIVPALVVKEAYAAPGWYTCYVNSTGNGWGTRYILLTEATQQPPVFARYWYVLTDAFGGGNQMLSTALTAMASGMKVQVYFDPAVIFSEVAVLYLLDQ